MPYKIETHDAEMTIKAAAKDKNETLYNEIKNLDLIAKDLVFINIVTSIIQPGMLQVLAQRKLMPMELPNQKAAIVQENLKKSNSS